MGPVRLFVRADKFTAVVARNISGRMLSNSLLRRTAAMTASRTTRRDQESSANQARPHINVTPLIDVLLVLLIIFMVVSPLTPPRFLARVPKKPNTDQPVIANIHTLVVTIKGDRPF